MYISKIKKRDRLERSSGKDRDEGGWVGAGPSRYRVLEGIRSAVLGLLLLSVVVSVILGSGPALFVTVIVAWSLLPVLVGPRKAVEAGCAFMLISVGVLVVVGPVRAPTLAQNGF